MKFKPAIAPLWRNRLAIAVILAFSLLWVRTYWRSDVLAVFTSRGNLQVLASYRGKIGLFISGVSAGERRAWTANYASAAADDLDAARDMLIAGAGKSKSLLGFAFATGGKGALGVTKAVDTYFYQVPDWLFIALVAAMLANRARLALRIIQRRRRGLCLACGYDLRGGQDICPECGVKRAEATVSS